MDAIEEYFQGEYIKENNKINEIDELVSEVIKSLTNSTPDKNKGWPYEISANTGIKQSDNYSFSTNAMILFVLAKFIGKIEIDSPLLPWIEWESSKSLKKQFDGFDISEYYKIFNDKSMNLSTVYLKDKGINAEDLVSTSGSFGFNDPFTLSWIAELLSTIYTTTNGPFEDIKKSVIDVSEQIVSNVSENVKKDNPLLIFGGYTKKTKEEKEEEKVAQSDNKTNGRKASNHIFPLLRVIHLYKSLCHIVTKIEKEQKKSLIAERSETQQGEVALTDPTVSDQMTGLEKLKNSLGSLNTTNLLVNLQNRINQQISHFTIQNSLFDTAELVMSLEGMLLLDENRRIDENLIRKVFEILEINQKNNLNWRPLKPFVTSPQGDVLLPLSIEIANSLLRICKLLERKKQFYFHEYAPIFNKYTQWLLANVSQCTIGDTTYKGWRSEHVQEPNLIHPWETAQVLTYLMTYKSMIQERIAHKSLKKCGLSCSDEFLNSNVDDTKWKNKWEKSLTGTKAYKEIRETYISRKNNKDLSFSMLLFGPPGTGKTAIGEDIAEVLKWRLITITPSDFIKNGEADVEGRAKSIFKTLEQQKDCVILFDEIDRLILDRDSIYYNNQGDMFQFMTPSMLVKIKDLRKAEKCIFIIATNYAERIDSAIKRAGRIDEKYLINLPNKEQRLIILKELIGAKIKESILNSIISSNSENDSDLQQKNKAVLDLKKVISEFIESKLKPDNENKISEIEKNIKASEKQLKKKEKELAIKVAENLLKETIAVEANNYILEDYLVNETVFCAYGELEAFIKKACKKIQTKDDFSKELMKVLKDQDKPAVRLSNYSRRFQKEENGTILPIYPFKEFFNLLDLQLEVTPIGSPITTEDQIKDVLKNVTDTIYKVVSLDSFAIEDYKDKGLKCYELLDFLRNKDDKDEKKER